MQSQTPPCKDSAITIAFLAIGGFIVLSVTAIAIWIMRRRKRNLLPVAERPRPIDPPPTLLQRSLSSIGIITGLSPTDRAGISMSTDARHLPLNSVANLALPADTHQPTRKVKSSYEFFLEQQAKREERERIASLAPSVSEHWPYQPMERPKPASY